MGDFIGVPITPQLWLDKEAQEAAELYCSVFQDSKITSTTTILIKERERNARYRPSCPRVALPSPFGKQYGWIQDKYGGSWQISPPSWT